MNEITVQELKNKIDAGSGPFVLDVREHFERYQSDLDYERKRLIPLGDLPDHLDELEEYRDKEVVCMCRSGQRSAKACRVLENSGFGNVKNLKGGINEWAREIDPSLPIY